MTTSRLTKIVATLGPASRNEPVMRQMLEKQASVFRFNYSHAEYDELIKAYKLVRRLSKEMNVPVAILSDLQGPKFRVGFFEEGESIPLEKGKTIRFAYGEDKGNAQVIKCNVRELVEALQVGNSLLLDDGSIELEVIERLNATEVVCSIRNSGTLKERKGVNVPDIRIPVPALTEKDKHDCKFALEQGTDFVALSFVQSADDVRELRAYMAELGYEGEQAPKIVCKIEKPQAVQDIDSILAETDVIMVARGDLGVELRPEYVPSSQKMMIRKANEWKKPVITATHMLESMISKPFPTRAEVSDVANAIYDGTDAVMLSGESAMGQYPVEAVSLMDRIAREAEKYTDLYRDSERATGSAKRTKGEIASNAALPMHQTIANAAVQVANECHAEAIIVVSYSGSMARRISKNKPSVPILAITPSRSVSLTANINYGVRPVCIENLGQSDEHASVVIERELLAQGLIQKGQTVVLCAGETNLLGLRNSILLYNVGDIPVQANRSASQACAVG